MSTHPNTILMCALTPDDLSRKTYRDILAELKTEDSDESTLISGDTYFHRIMEEGYDKDFQISASEGDIVFLSYVTYGHGERIIWSSLEEKKLKLEEWAKGICERHKCSYKIFISSNYW